MAAIPLASGLDPNPVAASTAALVGLDASLPPQVASALWRGNELGCPIVETRTSGFEPLDAELPGHGWPCASVTEILQPQYSVAEWRLLLPALAQLATDDKPVLLVASPHLPYFGGLRRYGLTEKQVVMVKADTPAKRLWVTEQAVKATGLASVVAWLPQARADQIRRLQVCAHQHSGPLFILRPDTAQHESSPAPLRLQLKPAGMDHLAVHILKRRGSPHDGWICLEARPPGFDRIADPRPSQALCSAQRHQPTKESADAAVLVSAAMQPTGPSRHTVPS